jgi:hypothetical protein
MPRAVGKQKPRQHGEGPERLKAAAQLLCECYGMTKLGLDGGAKWWNIPTIIVSIGMQVSYPTLSLCLPLLSAYTAGSYARMGCTMSFCATSSEWQASIR